MKIKLSAACALAMAIAGTVLAAPAMRFRTVVQSSFGGRSHAKHEVLQDLASYRAFFNGHAPVFVDFSRDDVLALSLGARPTGGYAIEVVKIDGTSSGGAVVSYTEHCPGPYEVVPQVITQPVHVVRVAKGAKHYTFRKIDPGVPGTAYSATIASSPAPLAAGHATTFDVSVFAPGGSRVVQFDPVHTQTMHMIVVSEDLEDFLHLHPTLQPQGDLEAGATLSLPQPYGVFLEYQPTGAKEQLTRVRLSPAGAHAAKPAWNLAAAFFGSGTKTLHKDGTWIRLRAAPNARPLVRAGVTAHLLLELRDASGGPANVTDYLGMPGHAIALSPDLAHFFHLHGTRGGAPVGGAMTGMSGGGMSGMSGMSHSSAATTFAGPTSDDLTFDITLPEPGPYKVFFQFQRAGRVVTAPFIVYASP